MNNNNQDNKHQRNYDGIYKVCAVMAAVAIVLACFAVAKVEDVFLKIVLFGISGTLLFFSIVFIAAVAGAKKIAKGNFNYFLYDKKTRQNASVEQLTFSETRKRIQKYMAMFKKGGKLFLGDLFDEKNNIPEAFHPLFCYELLYELSEDCENTERARIFLSFGKECADAFSKNLAYAGDTELSRKIQFYFAEYETGQNILSDFCRYISELRPHLEESVVKYTKEHINEFS